MSPGPGSDYVIGVDLSGPANTADTAGFCFRASGGALEPVTGAVGLDDDAVLGLLASVPASRSVIVGLDAPLSYAPGGGDRPGDRRLRRALMERGLPSGSVMPPLMTRMVYLTLRGLQVARAIERVRPDATVVEVHPGGAMALRDAGRDVVELKRSAASREALAKWLEAQGVPDPGGVARTDHGVAALACVLAAWRHACGEAVFREDPRPPLHPFAFVC